MITAYISFNSLSSWLSIRSLRRVREKTGVDIRWEPMLATLGNVTPEPGFDDPLAEYKARRARARRWFSEAEHRRMCERSGISEEAGARGFDALAVSLGLVWLAELEVGQETCFDYVEGVFSAHFRDGAKIDSTGAAASLLEVAKVPTDGFEGFALDKAGALSEERRNLVERGILFAPAFVVGGEVFHGRQHMPLIAWILGGRCGTPPV